MVVMEEVTTVSGEEGRHRDKRIYMMVTGGGRPLCHKAGNHYVRKRATTALGGPMHQEGTGRQRSGHRRQ